MRTDSGTAVLISLSAFGAAEVKRHGQLRFTELALAAGADGVEVRSELLIDSRSELPAIAGVVKASGKSVVYSSADDLWTGEGALDLPALERALIAAATLGASRIKMAIGAFDPASHNSVCQLRDQLRDGAIELLIENDQTATAGTLVRMQAFFSAAAAHGLPLGMTFDMGNWHWTGECPQQAAHALAAHVRYVHCKGVQRQAQRWVAVPLAESSAPWRAILRSMPTGVPWAIEYPLTGDDLLATARHEIALVRSVATSMAPQFALAA